MEMIGAHSKMLIQNPMEKVSQKNLLIKNICQKVLFLAYFSLLSGCTSLFPLDLDSRIAEKGYYLYSGDEFDLGDLISPISPGNSISEGKGNSPDFVWICDTGLESADTAGEREYEEFPLFSLFFQPFLEPRNLNLPVIVKRKIRTTFALSGQELGIEDFVVDFDDLRTVSSEENRSGDIYQAIQRTINKCDEDIDQFLDKFNTICLVTEIVVGTGSYFFRVEGGLSPAKTQLVLDTLKFQLDVATEAQRHSSGRYSFDFTNKNLAFWPRCLS